MKIIAIAATAKNGTIGSVNALPWNIPEDLKFFRDSTREQIVCMGRKTFESLGKPLPKRENVVITRDVNWTAPGVKVFQKLEDAISFYENSAEFSGKTFFVIGGGEIYRVALPLLDEVWLTEIQQTVEGDTFFPDYQAGVFQNPHFKLQKSVPQSDSQNGYTYSFNYYSRNV